MKKIAAALLLLLACSNPGHAANCGSNPYTLQNGQVANADQVMANFNNLLNCTNNNLLGKNNNLSDVQSSATSRTNLGLGSSAVLPATNTGGSPVTVTTSSTNNDIPVFAGDGSIGDSGIAASNVMKGTNNLSDVSNPASARSNIGAQANLGYTPLNPANNLSDVSNAGTARGNLGFGTFSSTPQTGSALNGNAGYSQSDGLSSVPAHYSLQAHLVCLTTNVGYAAGDVVNVDFGGSSRNDGLSIWINANSVGYSIGTNGIFVNTKGGGGGNPINTSDWQLVIDLMWSN